MRPSTVLLAGAIAVGLAMPPATAAPAPEVVDAAGDANGVNGQGFIDGAPSQSTPASATAFDITGVDFATYGKTTVSRVRGKTVRTFTPEGFTVTMTLAGAPALAGVYRVTGEHSACSMFWFEHYASPQGDEYSLRHNCASTGELLDDVSVDVKGTRKDNMITWTVPLKQVPKVVKVGSQIVNLGAQTRGYFVALTVPQFDEAVGTATYKVGG